MAEKIIKVGGKEVAFKATAALPRIYRMLFNRDIYKDMYRLEQEEEKGEDGKLEADRMEVFENVAYAMARHANPDTPKTIVEWLDQFELFSIYEILPEIVGLWNSNLETHVDSKKNSEPAQES